MRTNSLLSVIILIFLIVSCRDHTKTKEIDPLFHEFLNSIPKSSLPIKMSCGLPNGTLSTQDFDKFKTYIPKSSNEIYGTISSGNDSFHLILYGYIGDDIYPFLFSFDNQGKIIDSLDLIINRCGGADGHEIPHSYLAINTDLSIILTDTTKLIHFPGHWEKPSYQSDLVPDSLFVSTGDYIIDSLRITVNRYKINGDGNFVKSL